MIALSKTYRINAIWKVMENWIFTLKGLNKAVHAVADTNTKQLPAFQLLVCPHFEFFRFVVVSWL
jgi:hypothetical protein